MECYIIDIYIVSTMRYELFSKLLISNSQIGLKMPYMKMPWIEIKKKD